MVSDSINLARRIIERHKNVHTRTRTIQPRNGPITEYAVLLVLPGALAAAGTLCRRLGSPLNANSRSLSTEEEEEIGLTTSTVEIQLSPEHCTAPADKGHFKARAS